MNTFHITPQDDLAHEAYPLVRELMDEDPDTLVAVRGQLIQYDDGGMDWETLYTVSPCPDQERAHLYAWTYVRAGEWVSQYENRLKESKR